MMPLSLHAMLAAYRSRELSPVEVVRASLDRIEAVNPSINAIYHVEAADALRAAELSERRWKDGAPAGVLDGVPMTIKDALATQGMPSYRGSATEIGAIAGADHPTVARVRQAGAVLLGKSTMCDYGILASGNSSRHGVTRNPWNTDWNTGASSSGAAASVAAGIEPATIGTDIVGSIRIPASYCGLVGLKPSQGRVPYYLPVHPALVAGPMARNVADAALLLNVLVRPDARDFAALPATDTDYTAGLDELDPAGLRIVIIPDLGLGAATSQAVRSALDTVATLLESHGADIERRDTSPFSPEELKPVEMHYMARCLAEFGKADADRQELSPFISSWANGARSLSAIDFLESWNAVQLLRERAVRLIGNADFIILPSTADTAFEADRLAPAGQEPFSLWGPTCLFNLSEQPAASIPFGMDGIGKPIGIQIVGRRFSDRCVLRLARFIEDKAPKLGSRPA